MDNVVNVEQAQAWDGTEGARWAQHAIRHDAALTDYHEALVDAAAVLDGERVLDIGCGCGESTIAVAKLSPTGHALGIDLSSPMLELARVRAQEVGVDNVSFEHADAQVHAFDAESRDVVISRFGAMFFADQPAALANIGRALRPGGRVVFVAWTALDRNEWLFAVRASLAAGRDLPEPVLGTVGPFGLADESLARGWLDGAGFADVELREVQGRFRAGADVDDAFEFMTHTGPVIGLTETLDEPARAEALDQLRSLLAAHTGPDGVILGSSAWVITATKR